MDARTAESAVTSKQQSWLRRERASGRFYDRVMIVIGLFLLIMVGVSAWQMRRGVEPDSSLSQPLMAFLLIAILIPAIALMALNARKLAVRRAENGGLGSGRLHVRLVALFTAIAAVPTVLVAIFASILFQSGLEFWFSDRARGMLENTVQVAQATYRYELGLVGDQATTMSENMADGLSRVPIDDPRVGEALAAQTYLRSLNEAAIVRIPPRSDVQSFGVANGYVGMIDSSRLHAAAALLSRAPASAYVDARTPERISVLTKLNYGQDFYLYAARTVDAEIAQQTKRANEVLGDYRALLAKSRANQLKFNAALLLGALIIVGLSILTALKLADRLVRPVGELVGAAGRIEEGDFSARVPVTNTEDEIQTLATAFNRMAGRLDEQTGALRTANTQLDARRAFMEAVLSSVTAGVIALDTASRTLLVNRSAETLLHKSQSEIEGKDLSALSPDLAEFMRGDQSEANVIVTSDALPRTLAVKRVRYQDGSVLTFDDITDQLTDQRRAAWSDIARRIAHEIKNPLTPIQLAAERMQRRFGQEISSDKETFERLTGTIIRQVGDLRRMVDEFSNFARMPKPVFREENVHEIARQAVFLHEVAHPAISFTVDPPSGDYPMVCDRRQLAQALTNVVKNSVEAIEGRVNRGEHSLAGDRVEVKVHEEEHHLVIDVLDTGVGLPEDRERLTEPYVTTRVRGTGLGLAIVKKIVEDHMGEIAFLDRAGGGTHVRITFDTAKLAALATDAADDGNDDEANDGEEPS
jgi:two-component system nitrogen regulation sensor histidine kinase NtrY